MTYGEASRPEPVEVSDFFIDGADGGLWLNCPAALCGWQEWVAAGDSHGSLGTIAEGHIRDKHQ